MFVILINLLVFIVAPILALEIHNTTKHRKMQLKCRSIEAELTGIALLTCINTFVIVFFIYMSVKFS